MAKKGVTVKMDGLKDMYSLLGGLPLKLKANALKSVHRKTANVFIKKGMTSKHDADIAVSVSNERGDPTGVIAGFTSDFFWFRFLEYGTKRRENLGRPHRGRVKPRKGNRGIMPMQDFFRPMVDRIHRPMIKYLTQNYRALIHKFLERKITAMKRAAKRR